MIAEGAGRLFAETVAGTRAGIATVGIVVLTTVASACGAPTSDPSEASTALAALGEEIWDFGLERNYTLLIERDWYELGEWGLRDGQCEECDRPLAGRFAHRRAFAHRPHFDGWCRFSSATQSKW